MRGCAMDLWAATGALLCLHNLKYAQPDRGAHHDAHHHHSAHHGAHYDANHDAQRHVQRVP